MRISWPKALALSLGLHALFLLALVVPRPSSGPKPEVVWLDVDNRLGTGDEITSPLRASKSKAESGGTAAKQVPQTPGKSVHDALATDLGARGARLGTLAPPGAALILLVRTDRVRKSPYAEAVRQLLSVFYDYRSLLSDSGIDPVRDFDALFIATPNPFRITRTFLAIRHHLTRERLKKALAQSLSSSAAEIDWRETEQASIGKLPSPPRATGDKRLLYLLGDTLFLADPEFEGEVLAAGSAEKSNRPQTNPDGPPRSIVGRFDTLQKTHHEGLVLEAHNLRRLVRLPEGMQPPESLQITVPAHSPAELRGQMLFASARSAERTTHLIEQYVAMGRASLALRFLGIGALLDELRLARHGKEVTFRLTLRADEVNRLVLMFRDMIPEAPTRHRMAPDRGTPPQLTEPPQ